MSEQKCISGFPDETKAWETVLILFMSHMLSALTSFIQAILIAACLEKLPAFHNPFILSFSTSVHPCGPWHFWLPVTLSQGPLALQSTLPPPFPARFLAICVWPPRLSFASDWFAADSSRHERSLNWQASSPGPNYLVQWSWIVS